MNVAELQAIWVGGGVVSMRIVITGATGRGIALMPADIRDPGQLDTVMSHAGCVMHCAAKAGPWGDRQEFFEANVVGTRNVIDACRWRGIPKAACRSPLRSRN